MDQLPPKEGNENFDKIKASALVALPVERFKQVLYANTEIVIVDTRSSAEFINGFIPGSIFIGLEGKYAEWAITLLALDKPLLLVADIGKEEEIVSVLAGAGFKNFLGYLDGSFEAWINAGENVDLIISIEADELAMDLPHDPKFLAVDVRRITEYAEGHIKNAINIPLNDMTDVALLAGLEEDQNIYVYSEGGYRSVIASSLLKRQGIHNFRNVQGGWVRIKEEKKIPVAKDASVLN